MEKNGLHGLTESEVMEKIRLGQVNISGKKTSRTFNEILQANVFTLFNAILGSLLIIMLFVGDLRDALFGFVLIFNSLIGIVQELRAKYVLDRLSLINAPKARAIRNGLAREIEVTEVVLDDLLELHPGEQVIADGIILVSEGLEVDESHLTGESVPIIKNAGDQLLSGSYSVAGTCLFRASKVGPDAYIHRLSSEARSFSLARSELYDGINKVLRLITWSLLPMAIALFYSQLRADLSYQQAAVRTIAGLVGMIPQGLVLLTSIAFAVSVITLGHRKVLVNELHAVEGLARIDVLCLDKTGTLTEGILVFDSLVKLVSDTAAEKALGAISSASIHKNLTMTAIADAFPSPDDWILHGSIPFSSQRKWSAASFGEEGHWYLGAPEILLANASSDSSTYEQISHLTDGGSRILLLARSCCWTNSDVLPSNLLPVALLLFNEKFRSDVSETMKYFDEEGVTIKVISGDNPITTASVAKKAGIMVEGEPVDARFLPEDIAEIAKIMESNTVFGRVTPHQKQKMVAALHSTGHVVAMTGDGVNDVLALKDADIGIAMGSGVDVTKSIARIVLLDGKFSKLPGIVAEGRRLVSNIERVANLFLTKTVYIILIAIAIVFIGWPFPFLPRHLTLASELTIGIPAFFLALAPNLTRYKPGFLNRVMAFVLPVGAIVACSTLSSFIMAELTTGIPLEESMTIATMVLISISLWVVVILSRPLTVLRISLIATMLLSFVTVMAVPFSRHFFALTLSVWNPLVWAGLIVLIAILLIECVWRMLIKRHFIK
ncbi:MAG: HAD-IC family P-type ATPase [Clostridiaceae bacterium]